MRRELDTELENTNQHDQTKKKKIEKQQKAEKSDDRKFERATSVEKQNFTQLLKNTAESSENQRD